LVQSSKKNNQETFWTMQKTFCESLMALSTQGQEHIDNFTMGMDLFKYMVQQTLDSSATKWATLFKVNHEAFNAIQEAKNQIDKVMNNLGRLNADGSVMNRAQIAQLMTDRYNATMQIVADEKLTALEN